MQLRVNSAIQKSLRNQSSPLGCTGGIRVVYTDRGEHSDKLRKLWYQRVYRWCDDNDLTIRKFNKKSRGPETEDKIDRRILGSLQLIEDTVGLHTINNDEIWNLDETALVPMSAPTTVQTLVSDLRHAG